MMLSTQKKAILRDRPYLRALLESLLNLDPRHQIRHPLMFALEVISLLLTGLWLWELIGTANIRLEVVAGMVDWWLGLTVLYTNFAEALAAGRRQAQGESLRQGRREIKIKWLKLPCPAADSLKLNLDL
jgi:K+-transporting ATPase ATPase B chain